jgi:hypothetical protein
MAKTFVPAVARANPRRRMGVSGIVIAVDKQGDPAPHRPPDRFDHRDVPLQRSLEGTHPFQPSDLDLEDPNPAPQPKQPGSLAGYHLGSLLRWRAGEVSKPLALLGAQQILHVEGRVVNQDTLPDSRAQDVGDGPADGLT